MWVRLAPVVLSNPSMPPFRPEIRTLLSLAFAAVVLLAGCDDCPEVTCGPRVITRLNLPAGTATGATVVACHVDACVTATLPAAAAAGAAADLSFLQADVTGSLVVRADGSLQLMVRWRDGVMGDRYTIVVRDAAGAELASLDETAIFPSLSLSSGACISCVSVTMGDPA